MKPLRDLRLVTGGEPPKRGRGRPTTKAHLLTMGRLVIRLRHRNPQRLPTWSIYHCAAMFGVSGKTVYAGLRLVRLEDPGYIDRVASAEPDRDFR
ncbi:MAG: hypothetical protein WDM85_07810 [Caulobacteraceae bacterium]